MRETRVRNFGLTVLASAGLCLLLGETRAQNRDFALQLDVGEPRGLPQLPTSGAWGEIINVTSRWIVIQNHAGQQFPIAIEDIQELVTRWPSSLDALTPDSLVEAIGPNTGQNTIQTGFIDVFEGTDRTLVRPTYLNVLPDNPGFTGMDPVSSRFMTPLDLMVNQYTLYGWAFPVGQAVFGEPRHIHAVGAPIMGTNSLRLAVPANNSVGVVPDESGRILVFQITRGDPKYASKGDYAFLKEIVANPRGLRVAQLVLHKKLSLQEFNRNR